MQPGLRGHGRITRQDVHPDYYRMHVHHIIHHGWNGRRPCDALPWRLFVPYPNTCIMGDLSPGAAEGQRWQPRWKRSRNASCSPRRLRTPPAGREQPVPEHVFPGDTGAGGDVYRNVKSSARRWSFITTLMKLHHHADEISSPWRPVSIACGGCLFLTRIPASWGGPSIPGAAEGQRWQPRWRRSRIASCSPRRHRPAVCSCLQ